MKRTLTCFVALVLVAISVFSCSRPTIEAIPSEVAYYTCTMHPSVKLHDPKAKCPICSMDLIPVKKNSSITNSTAISSPDHLTEFNIPIARQQQFGVTYAMVTNKPVHYTLRTIGTVTPDRKRQWSFVSRIEGYVQKIEVASRGEQVEKNQPLLTIYSPDLLAAQREFLDLAKVHSPPDKSKPGGASENGNSLLDSARQRLLRANLSEEQVTALERSGKTTETLTFHSPFNGIIQDLEVEQGRRVMPGDLLVSVTDLSAVWVWANFYQDDLPLLQPGLPVTLETSSSPNEKFAGRIALVDPFLNEAKRTARIRIDVENSQLKLRPDMYLAVTLQLDAGSGLTVPVSAVLPTGERNIVFVDKGEGRLEPRLVEIVRKAGNDFVVKSGVTAGERVVSSANFLIDAEAKVQGALPSF